MDSARITSGTNSWTISAEHYEGFLECPFCAVRYPVPKFGMYTYPKEHIHNYRDVYSLIFIPLQREKGTHDGIR